MTMKQLESVMDYYSKLWCLARFDGNNEKAAWYRALYEQAEVKWKALQ